jgi:hypothetical protein
MLGKELLRRVEDRRARAVGLAGFLHSIPCRYILSTAIDNTKRPIMSTHVDIGTKAATAFCGPATVLGMTEEGVPTVGTTRSS